MSATTKISSYFSTFELTIRTRGITLRALFGAISSAVEHCLHTAGVTSSILVSPTIKSITYVGYRPRSSSQYGKSTESSTFKRPYLLIAEGQQSAGGFELFCARLGRKSRESRQLS